MNKTTNNSTNDYLEIYRGGFYGVLRWHQLDELWQQLKSSSTAWYVYQIGEVPPDAPLSNEKLNSFIDQLDTLLRQEHEEDYCGIVYVNNKENPAFIKVYDPNNLGSSCGSSGAPPPLPGWTISTMPPVDLQAAFPLPANRKRWWRRIFST